MTMADTPKYFTSLRPRQIPDSTYIRGIDAYLAAYHEKYKVISQALVDTALALKDATKASGIKTVDLDSLLAGWAMDADASVKSDLESPQKLIVRPSERFYPADFGKEGARLQVPSLAPQ